MAPVPPSLIANVPVILLASNLTANLFDSITKPPFDFRSTANVLPVFDKPLPAVICPAPENCENVKLPLVASPTVVPEVTVKPLSPLTVPSSTNVKAFLH